MADLESRNVAYFKTLLHLLGSVAVADEADIRLQNNMTSTTYQILSLNEQLQDETELTEIVALWQSDGAQFLNELHDSHNGGSAGNNVESTSPDNATYDVMSSIQSKPEKPSGNDDGGENIHYAEAVDSSSLTDCVGYKLKQYKHPTERKISFADQNQSEFAKLNETVNSSSLRCLFCDKCMESEFKLIEHMHMHEENDLLLSKDESDKRRDVSLTPESTEKEDPLLVHKCTSCDSCFSKTSDLLIHKFVIHKQANQSRIKTKFTRQDANFLKKIKIFRCQQMPVTNDGKKIVRRMFRCTLCDRQFVLPNLLNRHMKCVHSVYACRECKFEFNEDSKLRKHRKNKHAVTPSHQCKICRKLFSSNFQLIRHNNHIHLGKYAVTCNLCTKRFLNPVQLERHMVKHTGDGPHWCSLCKMDLEYPSRYKTHMRIHSGERPFSCHICLKTFKRNSEVLRHAKSHTNERPFMCDVCGNKFKDQTSMRQHIRAAHTDDKPYACEYCGKCFSRKDVLRQHFKTHKNKSVSSVQFVDWVEPNSVVDVQGNSIDTTVQTIPFNENLFSSVNFDAKS